MRTSFIFLAVAVAAIGCGDDTVTGSGGSGGGGTTSATTSATTSTTSTSSGEGGDSSTTSSTGGSSGDGGSNEGGSSGIPEWVPGETVTEGCENLNAHFAAIGDQLGCEVLVPGNCEEPDACSEEILAFINCLGEFTTPGHCECEGGEGEGGAGADGEAELKCGNDAECNDEASTLNNCLG